MKVRKQISKTEFRSFPKSAGQYRARQRLSKRHVGIWEHFVEHREQNYCDHETDENEDRLPCKTGEGEDPGCLSNWDSFRGSPQTAHESGEQSGGSKQCRYETHHCYVDRSSMQEGTWICSPNAIEGLLNHREHPGCGPKHHEQARQNDASRDVCDGFEVLAYEGLRTRKESENLGDDILFDGPSSDKTSADCEHDQQSRK